MTLSYRQRLGFLGLLGGCGVLLLLASLFSLQVVEHEEWARKARTVQRPRRVEGPRGKILDARGRVLAADGQAFHLVLKPAAWEGRRHECASCGWVAYYTLERLAQAQRRPLRCPRCRRLPEQGGLEFCDERDPVPLARALGISPADLLRRVETLAAQAEAAARAELGDVRDGKKRAARLAQLRRDHGWRAFRVVSDVSYEVAREVLLHPRRNPAFRIETERCRRYPGGPDFVHVIGREPPPGRPGRGLESRFDRVLRSEPYWVDPEGRRIGGSAPAPGLTVQLTIDAADQRAAMEALGGAEGALVVIDADRGAVLALASSPSYDPEAYRDVLERFVGEDAPPGPSPLIDRAWSAFHVPGSIMKPFTAAAALAGRVIQPSDLVGCDGHFYLDGKRVTGWLKCHHVHGEVNLHRALVKSCNVYFETVMARLLETEQLPLFVACGHRFGLGLPTGLEMEQDLARRITRSTFRFEGVRERASLIAAAIGQGKVLLTPAQVARAYAALATGRLPWLHVVARLGDRPAVPRSEPLGLPAAVLQPVRAALEQAASAGGTAAGHGLAKWNVAVKTGTAQRRRGRRSYNSWLAGYAPAQAGRPRIAFALVVLETPHMGAEACGPLLARFLRRFYGGEP